MSLTEPQRCIIVKRDEMLRDVGVFTGFGELTYTDKLVGTTTRLLQFDPQISDDPDRAFIFQCPAHAQRWAHMLIVPWGTDRDARLLRLTQWVLRKPGEFNLGVAGGVGILHIGRGDMHDFRAIERDAFHAGMREGEKRRAELDAAQ